MFTKAYADQRQVKGGGLHHLHQKRLEGANPHPTRCAPAPSMRARYRSFLAKAKPAQRAVLLARLKRGEKLKVVDRYGSFNVSDR